MKKTISLLLLLFVFSFTFTSAKDTEQNAQVTIDGSEITLQSFISQVEKQTNYLFVYSKADVDVSKVLPISAGKKTVAQYLNEALKGFGVRYVFENEYIVLTKENLSGDEKTVSGIVFDSKGISIPGAYIVVQGTKNGVVSDIDGKFTIKDVSENTLLEVSFLGYVTEVVKINGRSFISVTMKEDSELLNEVVVIGYGTQKRSTMTSSISSINTKEINKQVSANVASALQGRAAGVDIVQTGGIAGADVNIVIRGAASLTTTEPLYVIDGVFSNSGLSTINPVDIENIEILKDGSASAIYGSRAANGVVLITTKGGKKGKVKVDANLSMSVQQITNIPEFLSAEQWRSFANMVSDNSGLARAPENVNPTDPSINTRWEKEWLQFAPVYDANASVSGGSDIGTYNVSLGVYDQTGMTKKSGYKRYSVRANSSFKKGIFFFNENMTLTYKRRKPTSSFAINLPTLPLVDAQGRYASWNSDYYIETDSARRNNPFAGLNAVDSYSETYDLMGGINAGIEIVKGLKYTMSFGGNVTNAHSFTHSPVYYAMWNPDGTPDTDYGNPINSMSETRGQNINYTWDNVLSFDRTFGDHSINAIIGHSWMREFYRSQGYSTINDLGATNIVGFSSIDGKISANESNYALLSFFARANYSYKEKYLLSLSVRRDESSKFHKDNRVGYFPSGSLGWNVHNEQWFKNKIVSKLKVTASYGELGANFLEPYNFDPIAFGPIPYSFNGVRYTDGRAAYLKSKDLKWETSKTMDAGIEMGFFNDELLFTVNYFYKRNVDLLAPIYLNLSSGQVFEINTSNETPYVNTASVENKGWEVMVAYHKRINHDWNVSASVNMTKLSNKVLALGENVQPITSGGYSSKFDDAPSITTPGHAIGSFYGYKIDGFDYQGNFMFHDKDGNNVINAEDKYILGNSIPDFSYGINVDLTYKEFDLTMFFNGVYGNEIFNATRYNYYFNYAVNKPVDVLNSWTPTNTNTHVPIAKTTNYDGGNSLPSEFYIEDGSYFRMKNLQFGYSLPSNVCNRINIDKLRLYVGVQNVFTLTKYSGYDPEVSSNTLFSRGIDSHSYPNARTYTFGINFTF